MSRDWNDYEFNKKNYDKGIGVIKSCGSDGRMRLDKLDYENKIAYFTMLDDNNRIQATTFEFIQQFIDR